MHKVNKDPSVCLPASTRSLPAFSRLLPALPALPALLDEIWGGLAHVCWQSWQSRQSWQESRNSWQASTRMQGCWPAFSRLLPALPALLEETWGGLAHVCWQSWQSRQSWQESRKSWQASNMMQGCWQAFCQCEIQLCIIVVAHLQAHTNIVY